MEKFSEDTFIGKRFLGMDSSFTEADIVVFGAGFDGTTSFRPGTRFGPSKMRQESASLETYSPYQDRDIEDLRIHDAGDLDLPFGDTRKALDLIRETFRTIITVDKKPVMLGGEHLVTYPAIEALHDKFSDLHVIHFDAHTDLREDYLGVSLSHATVIRKVWDILGDGKIHSYGIRSGLKEEFQFGHEHLDFHPFDLTHVHQLGERLKGFPVYITLDLDVLDPSIMPGTGTPEPGGVQFKELLDALLSLDGLNIVGFDINELSPPYDPSGISTAVSLKLLREMLLLL